eukprot:CAMPEP_0118922634 /NCGR_PEP_ID=MMETSP1169-20130426/1501_1 /TAXON_ID=36882 /ORGANISM="Pyramimonas obovata, Strain CCMP722" /LENGTH=290 /DNA_ID=CAMNT_0006863545 /DNA_START=316 /DNA_END=1184 /DNA_ORIENTATION=+
MPATSVTQALEELDVSTPDTKICNGDGPVGETAVDCELPLLNGDPHTEQANGNPSGESAGCDKHVLGEGVQLMPVIPPVKKPFKPTPEMKAHLADIKARTKEISTKVDGGAKFQAAACSVAGSSKLRSGNEDRFSLMENVAEGVLMMAVYDGHGGDDTSDFLHKKLPAEMAKQVLMAGEYTPEGLTSALRKSVAFCEKKFCEEFLPPPPDSDEEEAPEVPEGGYTSSGACLLVALYVVEQRMLMVANVGDSRAVLALPPGEEEGCTSTAVGLSRDQTAGNPDELARVLAA